MPDGDPVEEALREAVDLRSPWSSRPGAPASTPPTRHRRRPRRSSTATLPGVAEAIRAYGVAAGVPTAVLSRGLAGVADQTVVVNLPGSRGGVKDGLAVLAGVLAHAVDQVAGEDHTRSDAGGAS